ncbi:hypothetical protein KY285_014309 [Solanum tuberosum]|nr:hypothetical protein KY285_014309 [Solanum tuberosum]
MPTLLVFGIILETQGSRIVFHVSFVSKGINFYLLQFCDITEEKDYDERIRLGEHAVSYLDKRGQQPILIPSKKWSCLKLITNYYTTMLTTFKTGVGSATFIFKLQDHLPVTANSKVNTLLAKQIEAVILSNSDMDRVEQIQRNEDQYSRPTNFWVKHN